MLYLYLSDAIASNIRSIKFLSSWLGKHEVIGAEILTAITETTIRRHARAAEPLTPTIADVRAAIRELQLSVAPSAPRRQAATAASSSISANAAAASTATSNPRKRNRASIEAPASRPSSIAPKRRRTNASTPELARSQGHGQDEGLPSLIWMPDVSSTFVQFPTVGGFSGFDDDDGEDDEEDDKDDEGETWDERLALLRRLVELGDNAPRSGNGFAARQAYEWHRSVVHSARMALEAEEELTRED